mmetsp:Transcript_62774/g.147214  ORF Transcript_62774/g.147214 Transcript_62774/m.147214 type:complete len:262 (-) Transcript_62774:737-1522(-)
MQNSRPLAMQVGQSVAHAIQNLPASVFTELDILLDQDRVVEARSIDEFLYKNHEVLRLLNASPVEVHNERMPQVPQYPQLLSEKVCNLLGRGKVFLCWHLHSHACSCKLSFHNHCISPFSDERCAEGDVRPVDQPLLFCCNCLHRCKLHSHRQVSGVGRREYDAAERMAHHRAPEAIGLVGIRLDGLSRRLTRRSSADSCASFSSREGFTGERSLLQTVLGCKPENLLFRQVLLHLLDTERGQPFAHLDIASPDKADSGAN